MNTSEKIKVLIVGDSGVGKSCLVNLICNNNKKTNPSWTIGCSLDVKLHEFNQGTPDQEVYYIELWDIGGNKTHSIARHIFFSNYHAIILVYDLTNFKSKSNLKKWLSEVLFSNDNNSSNKNLTCTNDYIECDREMLIDKNIPILIVGTKLDLVEQNLLSKNRSYINLLDNLGADEIFLDNFSLKSFSPGSTNSVTLSRFFDKVILKKLNTHNSEVLRFFEKNRQKNLNKLVFNKTNKILHFD